MVEKEIDLIELIKKVFENKKKLVLWIVAGVVVGVIMAYSIPKTYETKVLIIPESASGSSGNSGLGGIAAMMGVGIDGASVDGINTTIYPDVISSTPFIMEFADINVNYKDQNMCLADYLIFHQRVPWWGYIISPNLFLYSPKPYDEGDGIDYFKLTSSQSIFASRLKSKITVDQDKKTGIFSISVIMQDRVIAAIVSDSLLTKFQRYIINYRTSKTRQDLIVTEKMLEDAKQAYYDIDKEYAQTMDRNRNIVQKSAQILIDRLDNERSIRFNTYRQLAAKLEMTKLKLQEDSPVATIIEPARVAEREKAPNKKIIIIGFAFLSAIIYAAKVLFKELSPKNDNN